VKIHELLSNEAISKKKPGTFKIAQPMIIGHGGICAAASVPDGGIKSWDGSSDQNNPAISHADRRWSKRVWGQ
jgi:hypothetical protein